MDGNGLKKHICATCGYNTNKLCNYKTHLARKIPCVRKVQDDSCAEAAPNGTPSEQNVTLLSTQVDPASTQVDPASTQVDPAAPNVPPAAPNVPPAAPNRDHDECKSCIDSNDNHDHVCVKCNKVLCSKFSLQKHLKTCTGVSDPLICPHCHKSFNSKYGKYKHLKNNRCPQITNNNINNNTYTNNLTFNNDNSTTNNMIINFEDYNHDHIDGEQFLRDCRKKKSWLDVPSVYTYHAFFNPKYPETRNIALFNMRTDYQFIDVYNNRWEKEVQSECLQRVANNMTRYSSRMLKKEDPEHLPDLSEDSEERDVVKTCERNMMNRKPKHMKGAINSIKKTIYNNSK